MKNTNMAQVADKALDKAGIIVEKAAEAANDIFAATAGIVTNGIEQYGSSVIEAVLWVVRIDAVHSLLVGFLCLTLSSCIIWATFYRKSGNLWGWAGAFKETHRYSDSMEYLVPIITTITALAIFIIGALPRVTDVWLYTAVVKPELYLVKKTVDLVEKNLNAPAAKK